MKTAFDAAKRPKKHGDRFDGSYLRELDAMHKFMPLLYPGRCDNEAYISVDVDLTNIDKYLEKKNEVELQRGDDAFKYTLFHLVVTALLRTMTLRPKLNWFIANKRMFARKNLVASFVVKKKFSDTSEEALAIVEAQPQDNVDTIHEKIRDVVFKSRSDTEVDGSTASMNMVGKLPFPILRFFVWFVRVLDRHGHVPRSFIESDPYYTSVVLSNLGSIKLKCGYHHLTNWGTNSLFVIIGEMKKRPVYDDEGNLEMHNTVELGITIDERLADGYYYSKSIRLLKKLLENPELLEEEMTKDVEY